MGTVPFAMLRLGLNLMSTRRILQLLNGPWGTSPTGYATALLLPNGPSSVARRWERPAVQEPSFHAEHEAALPRNRSWPNLVQLDETLTVALASSAIFVPQQTGALARDRKPVAERFRRLSLDAHNPPSNLDSNRSAAFVQGWKTHFQAEGSVFRG